MLHAAILRSPQAHARIRAIDASRALAIPGVVAVFTFQDIAPYAKPIPIRLYPLAGLERFLQYPLAHEKVRYVGNLWPWSSLAAAMWLRMPSTP